MTTGLEGNKVRAHKPRITRASIKATGHTQQRDVVALAWDVYEQVFGTDEDHDGSESLRHVVVKSEDKYAQWILFGAQLDRALPNGEISIGATTSHTALTLLVAGSVLVRATTPVVLEHVVLTFPPELYDEAKFKYEKERKLDLDAVVVRHGDNDAVNNFSVRVCEPVDQGVLDKQTKITVVKGKVDAPPADFNMDDIELEISKFLSAEKQPATDFELQPLESPVELERLVPQPMDRALDPETLGFVKIEQLGKIGCFSGDMVTVKTGEKERKLRLYSFPEPNTASSCALYVTPMLLYNIGGDKVTISRCDDCAIPTATEVTISRVAAPSTTDRQLQPACLSGLRTYFESCKRIAQEGDVLALPIDTLLAQTLYGNNDEENVGVLPAGKPNDIAWFKITALQSKEGQSECYVDPSSTRMIQSGLETQPVPSTNLGWRRYFALPEYPQFDASDGSDFLHAKKLGQLITASISPHGVTLQTTILVHSSKRGTGKTTLLKSVAGSMGVHLFEIDCYGIIGESDAKTIGMLRARLDRACTISPCLVLLRHIDAIAKKSEQDGGDTGIIANLLDVFNDYSDKKQFIVSATVGDIDKLSEAIRSKFKFEVEVPVPSESERQRVFEYLCSRPLPNTRLNQGRVPFAFATRSDVSMSHLALQSAGLTPPDLESIMDIAKVKAMGRLGRLGEQGLAQEDVVLGYGGLVKLTPEDLEESISEARTKYSDSIGAPRIPNVGWEDVGGLDGVKKEILDTIEMPLKYPQLFSGGMKKRSGILFYGPPGTGKTLLAKAIATSFSLNFFSVKGPELLNMYIGESEANVRKVFQKARDAKPCVVFFDELDSVAPKRGNQGDSGGVMDRIVSQLLAELDGMSGAGGEGVFVVGATNRPDLLDEALLRPGRFDKMLYLGISDTHAKQQTILEALTRKFALGPSVSLQKVAEKCAFTYTGADFYALSSDAMLNAMTRTAGVVDDQIKQFNAQRETPVSTRWWFQNMATDEDVNVKVTMEDFDKAQHDLVPSVSAEELQHYLRVRQNFEGGAQPQAHSQQEKQPLENGSMTVGEYLNGATTENGHAHEEQKEQHDTESVQQHSKPVLQQKPKPKKNKGKAKIRDN